MSEADISRVETSCAGAGPAAAGSDASLVGFGKHRDLTYAQLRAQEPAYCEWVLGRRNPHDEAMIALKAWLEGRVIRQQAE